jgi:hypothetical protein
LPTQRVLCIHSTVKVVSLVFSVAVYPNPCLPHFRHSRKGHFSKVNVVS